MLFCILLGPLGYHLNVNGTGVGLVAPVSCYMNVGPTSLWLVAEGDERQSAWGC